MDRKLIVFSGMPASGKDTVTDALCASNSLFVPFKKHRSVSASDKLKDTYFNISVEEFEEKIKTGEFVQYHERYGRYYGISENVLYDYLKIGSVPIIHIGRIENFYTLCGNMSKFEKKYGCKTDVCHIQLWETMDVLKDRITARDKTEEEIKKRLAAMRQEFRDSVNMMSKGERPFTLVIKNSELSKTCQKISQLVFCGSAPTDDGYAEFWDYLKAIKDAEDEGSI